DYLPAAALLEPLSAERPAPARRCPARACRAHETHHEFAELVRLYGDTDAHDLGPVGHTPTHHPSHPRRKNMSDGAIRHPPNQLDKTVQTAGRGKPSGGSFRLGRCARAGSRPSAT